MLLNCGVGKTLESPLDSKEIKPVNLKGNQSWIFIGRTDAEAETPILWPPDKKSWLIGKDPDAEKDWRQEEKGMTEDEMFGWHHWLDGQEFEQALGVGEGKPGVLQSMGSQKVGHNWVTELNWTVETESYQSSQSFFCLWLRGQGPLQGEIRQKRTWRTSHLPVAFVISWGLFLRVYGEQANCNHIIKEINEAFWV